MALLLFLASLLPPAPGGLPVNLVLLKWAFAVFGLGLFIAGPDLRERLCGARSDRIRPLKRIRQIVASLLLFLAGIALVVLAI